MHDLCVLSLRSKIFRREGGLLSKKGPWTDWFKRKSPLETMTGWWFFARLPPLKNDGLKISWDDDIPNIWKNKSPNHQPDELFSTSSIVVLSYFSPKPIQ